MDRVRLIVVLSFVLLWPWNLPVRGEEMDHDPDPPPIYSAQFTDPNIQEDRVRLTNRIYAPPGLRGMMGA
ncbi:MAG: hypothetical protein JXQ73_09365 [Phycisphaerae bacterium]|nr:hypothetical protein [Phycisphaerae bacterium]